MGDEIIEVPKVVYEEEIVERKNIITQMVYKYVEIPVVEEQIKYVEVVKREQEIIEHERIEYEIEVVQKKKGRYERSRVQVCRCSSNSEEADFQYRDQRSGRNCRSPCDRVRGRS